MLQLSAEDPRAIGPYEIVGKLGEGGMGTVYKGRSRGGRSVAVKVAKRELAADPDFRARFRTEIEAAQRVGGFHTAQVIDADPDARPPWMTTAFIPGRTLADAVAEDGPMDETRLRSLGAALAEALQAIHGNGLVHRDLKPANIILSDDGPRVLDFGIARALAATRFTHTHVSVGTPGFFSPEQVQGDREIGPAADVFALGAVLVHAAGGRPFGEGDSMTLMYRAVHDRPDLSALPGALRPLVESCMAKEADLRPTPEEVLTRIAPDPVRRPAPAPAPVPAPPAPGAFGPAPSTFTDVRSEPEPPAQVFQRGWTVRTVEYVLWFMAFSAVAAPFITLEAVNADNPGSVFHDELPLLLPAKALYSLLFLLSLRAFYPYRVTVDADGIRFRKCLRTVHHPWHRVASAEPRASSLVLRLKGKGGGVRRRTVRLRWPARGRGHEGLRAALRTYAPPGA
ncbi:serine/threonine-protein kinase [Streptomyces sp. NPDC048172]|uniref:serine/threonine-protein kinase n=1 Tax=Streptomyces sp. NPDC048172 TaxID=3365505 RepID=UPI00371123B9